MEFNSLELPTKKDPTLKLNCYVMDRDGNFHQINIKQSFPKTGKCLENPPVIPGLIVRKDLDTKQISIFPHFSKRCQNCGDENNAICRP